MSKMLSYDKENDILAIHKGFSSEEKFKGNIDVGDLILDVSTTGKIKGIEIMNATNFLKPFIGKEIKEDVLAGMSDADFTAIVKPNGIIISLTIKSKNMKNDVPATIAVPLEKPILSR